MTRSERHGEQDFQTQWRVHVGAHKTATTHLQELLEGNDANLLRHGVDFLPTAKTSPIVRSNDVVEKTGLRGLKQHISRLTTRRSEPTQSDRLRGIMRRKPTTVLSHEDQLGFTQHSLLSSLYKGTEKLRTIEQLPDAEKLDIFLSIRSFDTFFVSAFCEACKPFHDMRNRLDDRKRTFRESPPSWFEFATRIANRFPNAGLHVWTFEDYLTDPNIAIQALTGVHFDNLESLPAPSRTKSPSLRAIALAEGLDPQMSRRERMRQVQAIYLEHPKEPGEKIDLFTEEETSWLKDCYRRDLERLEACDRITLLKA
jgi:hypothetical protein